MPGCSAFTFTDVPAHALGPPPVTMAIRSARFSGMSLLIVPHTDWLPPEVEKDSKDFTRTGADVKRVASAVGEGAMAIMFVHECLKHM